MFDRSLLVVCVAVGILAAASASSGSGPQPGEKWLFDGAPTEFLSALLVVAVSAEESCGPLALIEVRETDGSGAIRFWLSRSALTASVSKLIDSKIDVGPPKRGFTWGALEWPAEPPAVCPVSESVADALRIFDALRKLPRTPPNKALNADVE